MPPSTRRTPTDTPSGTGPPVEPHGGGSAGRDEPTGAPQTSAEQDERTTMSLRLPFMTLSVTRPRHDRGHGAGELAHRGTPGTAGAAVAEVGSAERLLFYTGLAALGAVGVIEWPVAAVVAAGTYIAARTRPTPTRTPTSPTSPPPPPPPPPSVSGAPGAIPSARAARTEIPDAPVEVGMPPHV